ncbi:putative multidrug resistance protein MdtD [Candidatus Methanoplasma termitum]|uniref:MdtD2 protein n=1 Tax=Candidatus Methanoplasma termitum TaxID=1577791 RepID=A0A0A7LAZ2_9ARCH|nr:MFS transporter [Candidatus Methanoplasma termitum]AIZ56244.1 putative multidrug resistance protein MdtD [Candidatus Methanoplasma termitum]MCL2333654.1 MFS transporter [Candidatus Methanoplasma sp.]
MTSYARSISIEMKTILVACCVGVFIMPLMSTMMNLALEGIGHSFGVGPADLALVNTTFIIGSVVAMVPLARASDIIGRKKVFIIGIIVTAICSVIAAFSPTFFTLLAMRFGMGVGSATIELASIAMLTEVFPLERRGWAIGMQVTCVYAGIALGPVFGGTITEFIGWRAIFFFVLPLALISLTFISKFKRDLISHKGASMDYRGALLFSAAIMITMMGVINLPPLLSGETGPSSLLAPVLVIIGAIMAVYFVRSTKRSESPVLDFNLFKYKVFLRSCIAAFMNYASSFSVSFFLALYLQSIGALTPMQAGLVISIQPAIQVLLTLRSGSKSDNIKDKRILPTAGMILTSLGVLMIMFFGITINLWLVCGALVVLGIGYGIFSAPNTNTIMSSVPPKNRGAASGMVALVRQLGMITSMTVAMCAISLLIGSVNTPITPETPELFGSFISVLQLAFGICFAMCIVGTIASWFRGKNPEGISEFQ